MRNDEKHKGGNAHKVTRVAVNRDHGAFLSGIYDPFYQFMENWQKIVKFSAISEI